MSQILTTTARFKCPKCHKPAECQISVPEPNWGAGEKFSDLVSNGETELHCPSCDTSFSGTVSNSASGCQVELDEYPNTRVGADYAFFSPEDDFEDWVDQDPPANPGDYFLSAQNASKTILQQHGLQGVEVEAVSAGMVNRMVFVQQISAFEAFLGDALLLLVLEDERAVVNLVTKHKHLVEMKVTLAEIARSSSFLQDRVKAYLKSVLYHNLGLVQAIYRDALGVELLDNNAVRTGLQKAIELRHDCVHRNGRDKDGNEVVLKTPYVLEVMELIYSFVNELQTKLEQYRQQNGKVEPSATSTTA